MSLDLAVYAYEPSAFTGLERAMAEMVSWWTKSKWAHIGGMLGDSYYEADFFAGVRRLEAVPRGGELVFSMRAPSHVAAWLDRQLGKPYDLLALAGFVLDETEPGRSARGKWICSELWAAVLRKSHYPVLNGRPAWRINPEELVQALRG